MIFSPNPVSIGEPEKKEDHRLAADEALILKLIQEERELPTWILARLSPIGMRETQAIVEYLKRKGLIAQKTIADAVGGTSSLLVNNLGTGSPNEQYYHH
jgi:hypothetical protein